MSTRYTISRFVTIFNILCLSISILNACTFVDSTELKMEKRYPTPIVARGSVDTVKEARDIQEAIKKDISIHAYSLNINVTQDEVILGGSVDSEYEKNKIEQIVSSVSKNKVVSNLIITPNTPNDILVARVKEIINYEGLDPNKDLKFTADNAIVTVYGQRHTHQEIDKILAIILNIDGVKNVSSKIELITG